MYKDRSAFDVYMSANRAAKKYRVKNSGDEFCGYLPSIDKLIRNNDSLHRIALGVNEIPIDKIVGSYTAARCTSYSGNFMPLLSNYSEFAAKWQSLYVHHMNEGISDPIKAVEYMGNYYVIEGSKRVSVMNCAGAYSITGDVVRLVGAGDVSG